MSRMLGITALLCRLPVMGTHWSWMGWSRLDLPCSLIACPPRTWETYNQGSSNILVIISQSEQYIQSCPPSKYWHLGGYSAVRLLLHGWAWPTCLASPTPCVVVRQEQPVLSGTHCSSFAHRQMSIVFCLQRFPMKIENCHMTPGAATRTPEAATLATLVLPINWRVTRVA